MLAGTSRKSSHISFVGSKTVGFFPSGSVFPRHFWWQIRNRNELLRVVRKFAPDIIHCNSTVASVLLHQLKCMGKPIVVTVHGDYAEIAKIVASRGMKAALQGWIRPHELSNYVAAVPLYEMLLQCEMNVADSIVAVAKHVEDSISRRKCQEDRITTIYNGVAWGNNVENKTEQQADVVKVVYVGRLVWIKGVTLLLKALDLLRFTDFEVTVQVIGDGPLRSILKRAIRCYRTDSLNISLTGFVTRDQVIRNIEESVAVLVPSYYEGCPTVLLESIALGTPVLVSDFRWSREFVSTATNVLRTDYDGDKFYRILKELAEHSMCHADHSVFEAQQMVDKYSSLYESLI